MRKPTSKKRIVICSAGGWKSPGSPEGGKFHPTNDFKMVYSVASDAPGRNLQAIHRDEGSGPDRGLDRAYELYKERDESQDTGNETSS